jgi:hypothetical protein
MGCACRLSANQPSGCLPSSLCYNANWSLANFRLPQFVLRAGVLQQDTKTAAVFSMGTIRTLPGVKRRDEVAAQESAESFTPAPAVEIVHTDE